MIGHIDLLPALFEKVILPEAVQSELTARNTPSSVRSWMADRPVWVEVLTTPEGYFNLSPPGGVHEGEKTATALAFMLKSDLLLMDDRKGVNTAEGFGLLVTRTLGVLDLAAERGLVNFDQAIRKLERTNFRRPEALLDALLRKHASEGGAV